MAGIALSGCASGAGSESAAGGAGGEAPAGECTTGDSRPASGSTAASGSSSSATTVPATLEQSGYLWTGARMLFVTVPVDGERAEAWLPPGLTLAAPATATLFVAEYPLTSFGSIYNEAAVLLHVEHETVGPGWHCPWMMVDDDTALVLGRELLGFPKRMADIAFEETDESIVGTVTRKGTEVLRLEAATAGLTEAPGRVWTDHIINAHGAVVGGMRLLDIAPLVEEVHERSEGTGTATLASSPRDPLGELGGTVEGEAVFAVVDFAKFPDSAGLPVGDIPLDWALATMLTRAM